MWTFLSLCHHAFQQMADGHGITHFDQDTDRKDVCVKTKLDESWHAEALSVWK